MSKLSLSRRSFVKASAIAMAATSVGFAAQASDALAEGEDATAGEVKRIRSCCRACGKVECGVWVTVQDNKVIKVEGDESNAHSRGHCCAKSQSSMLALYHPDRLRYCMKRTNPKGEDDPGWVRISLAEAFDEAGSKFKEVVEKYGGQAVVEEINRKFRGVAADEGPDCEKAPSETEAADISGGKEADRSSDQRKGLFRKKCECVANQYLLSARENEVLFYLARGFNAAYLQEKLYISEGTAKTHIRHIYAKTNVHSQQELMRMVNDVQV